LYGAPPTPQRMRRFACLQDCLLTLTCHLAKSQARTKQGAATSARATSQARRPLPREEGARYGNCQERRAKKVRELTRATSHYISTSARATTQARRPLPREEGAITGSDLYTHHECCEITKTTGDPLTSEGYKSRATPLTSASGAF
jgi:hypothetical protein